MFTLLLVAFISQRVTHVFLPDHPRSAHVPRGFALSFISYAGLRFEQTIMWHVIALRHAADCPRRESGSEGHSYLKAMMCNTHS